MIVKLMTEHNLEFLSLKEGCRGSSESTLVKMSNVENLMPRLNLILHVVENCSLFISGSHQRRMPRFKSASKAPSFLLTFPKISRSPK